MLMSSPAIKSCFVRQMVAYLVYYCFVGLYQLPISLDVTCIKLKISLFKLLLTAWSHSCSFHTEKLNIMLQWLLVTTVEHTVM